jgi:GDPmannose 4,6-dehydratase
LPLGNGDVVRGVKCRSSSFNTGRIEQLYEDPRDPNSPFVLHYGDLTNAREN